MIPKPEMKTTWSHENEVNLSTLAQGAISSGPALTQGNTAITRLGNEVRAMSLHLKGVLYNNSTQESLVRLMIVGGPGSLDPNTTIFRTAANGTTSGPTGVTGLDAMYYPINKMEYHVYKDKLYRFGPSASGSAATNTRSFSTFVKLGGRKITYKQNLTGTGNQSWQYHIVWIAADANDDTTTGTNVELSQLTRFWFTDA